MIFNDTLTIIYTDLDDYGQKVTAGWLEFQCKVISKSKFDGNDTSSSMEKHTELKVYIPYKKSEPYSDFMNSKYERFKFDGMFYDVTYKAAVKDFFGKIDHYEMSLVEDRDAR